MCDIRVMSIDALEHEMRKPTLNFEVWVGFLEVLRNQSMFVGSPKMI